MGVHTAGDQPPPGPCASGAKTEVCGCELTAGRGRKGERQRPRCPETDRQTYTHTHIPYTWRTGKAGQLGLGARAQEAPALENAAQPGFPQPWGSGRPRWALTCLAAGPVPAGPPRWAPPPEKEREKEEEEPGTEGEQGGGRRGDAKRGAGEGPGGGRSPGEGAGTEELGGGGRSPGRGARRRGRGGGGDRGNGAGGGISGEEGLD